MDRREILVQALREHGISDSAQIESHLRGCDLSSPVSAEVFSPGAIFDVWVRDGGNPGKYGAPAGEDPKKLGIVVDNRHVERYRVRAALRIVRCTAATFPEGLVERVGGFGGGVQYLLPPGWLEKVEKIL